MPPAISVTILAKNNEATLPQCLEALRPFPEVILLDNGSTDNTVAVASRFPNVKLFHSPFIGFGPLKNLAASYASHDWILSIDSDEVLTPELGQSILSQNLSPAAVYQFLRHNYYRKRLINACGWENDYVLRLYHRTATAFSPKEVHEGIQKKQLQVVTLPGILLHYSYQNATQLVQKMNHYSSLFAQENKGRKKSSVLKALYKGGFSFFRNYVLKKGFLYGADGFLISTTNALGSFYKYYKLHEENAAVSEQARTKPIA
jgi:glycosyltransferase involved in cell wall biosynthesis